MNAIEKVKKLCLEPFCLCHGDGQISECVLDVGCPENCFYTEGRDPQVTEKTQCHYWQTVDPNPNIADVLGPLAPELIAMWEAGILMGRAFNALAEAGGDDEALGSAMHQAFTHFAETQNALNAKADEVLK